MTKKERYMTNECYFCEHRREVPGDAHIRCVKPDKQMTGARRGFEMGWFFYPHVFDPVWKTKMCDNYTDGKITVKNCGHNAGEVISKCFLEEEGQ